MDPNPIEPGDAAWYPLEVHSTRRRHGWGSGTRVRQPGRDPLAGVPITARVEGLSDVVAIGTMLAIKEAGLRIPKDIAVVGFDDIPLAEYYDPPLTTIRLPAFGLGWAGGERLIRLIQGEGLDHENVLLNSELIVRKSSFENLLLN